MICILPGNYIDLYTPILLVGYYNCTGSQLENTFGSSGDIEIVKRNDNIEI